MPSTGSGVATITREDVLELATFHDEPVVSLYLPTLRSTYLKEQNSNRLKTLYYEARSRAKEFGTRRVEWEKLLDPVWSIVNDGEFWRHQLDGLAIFVSLDRLVVRHLPFTVDDFLHIGPSAYIAPLLPMSQDGRFHVLALSRKQARLIRADRSSVERLDLNRFGVPASLEEALRYDDLAGSRSIESHATGRAASRLQTHSQAAGRTGKHVWHGHGSKATEIKEQVARFLHLVEEGVSKALAGSDAPLIVAAVSSEAEMYRNLADVHHPVEGIVEGNPDLLTDDQLADIGRPAAQELLRGRLEEHLEAYTTAIGSGKASTDPREIVIAARSGRVDTLFVERDARLWGDLNALSPTRSTPQRGDEELIDAMARYTLINGGEAFQVEAGDMPERANAAAIFRY